MTMTLVRISWEQVVWSFEIFFSYLVNFNDVVWIHSIFLRFSHSFNFWQESPWMLQAPERFVWNRNFQSTQSCQARFKYFCLFYLFTNYSHKSARSSTFYITKVANLPDVVWELSLFKEKNEQVPHLNCMDD